MSQALLIEEAGDRATRRLHQLLTLVLLGFEEGEARARDLVSATPDRIIDPVASACFGEARELILRGSLFAALFALDAAAAREPDCYHLAQQAIRRVVLAALDDVVALELASAERGEIEELELARN
ncbi:MAG: hypothetical protein R6X02_12350 [Enhygromyxa sp.]